MVTSMDRLLDILSFVKTAQTGGFSRAARLLNTSQSTVSKSVARLEEGLGIKLLHRTTRHVRLTEEGEVFLSRCIRILEELEEAEEEVQRWKKHPSGTVRINTIVSFARAHIVPLLPEFRQRYPDIHLHISFTDLISNLTEENVDIAIRTGTLSDSQLIAKTIIPKQPMVLCASPSYLATRGHPTDLADLYEHDGLGFRFSQSGRLRTWQFDADIDFARTPMKYRFVFDDADAMQDACIAGLGIMQQTTWIAYHAVERGELVLVLPQYASFEKALSMIWQQNVDRVPRVRATIDFLLEKWQLPPYWDRVFESKLPWLGHPFANTGDKSAT